VENLYNRVENLDELIRSVKLPYLAWKVLFVVNKDIVSNQIVGIVQADQSDIDDALQILVTKGLIFVARPVDMNENFSQTEAPEISEEMPSLEDVETKDVAMEDVVTDAVETEAVATEDADTEDVAVEAVETEDVVTEDADAEDEDFSDILNEVQDVETAEADVPVREIEIESEIEPEIEEDFFDDSLEEETDDDELDLKSQDLPHFDDEPTGSTDKIVIDIPEEDELIDQDIAADEDVSNDLEIDLNMTGMESVKLTTEPVHDDYQEREGYKTILVIDDSLVIRKMVEIALEDEEYIIETAVSGKEGLDMMDSVNPDLVILDMLLPDINGMEILKTIKASRKIPVVMLSGKDSPQMIEMAKKEGAEDFLPKPFRDDDLVEKIKNLI